MLKQPKIRLLSAGPRADKMGEISGIVASANAFVYDVKLLACTIPSTYEENENFEMRILINVNKF